MIARLGRARGEFWHEFHEFKKMRDPASCLRLATSLGGAEVWRAEQRARESAICVEMSRNAERREFKRDCKDRPRVQEMTVSTEVYTRTSETCGTGRNFSSYS